VLRACVAFDDFILYNMTEVLNAVFVALVLAYVVLHAVPIRDPETNMMVRLIVLVASLVVMPYVLIDVSSTLAEGLVRAGVVPSTDVAYMLLLGAFGFLIYLIFFILL